MWCGGIGEGGPYVFVLNIVREGRSSLFSHVVHYSNFSSLDAGICQVFHLFFIDLVGGRLGGAYILHHTLGCGRGILKNILQDNYCSLFVLFRAL